MECQIIEDTDEFEVNFIYKTDILSIKLSYNFWNVTSDEWMQFINACQNNTGCIGYEEENNGGGYINTSNGKTNFEISKYGCDFCGSSNNVFPNELCIDAFLKVYKKLKEMNK